MAIWIGTIVHIHSYPSRLLTKSFVYVSRSESRLLTTVVDLGCVFIGHGLSKDFRTISKVFSLGDPEIPTDK
jgi:hypothetical protein